MRILIYTFISLAFLVRLPAQGVLNGSFEDSVAVTGGFAPAGWTNSGFGFGYSNDAFDGSKAAQVWNWYYYSKGWVANGASSIFAADGGQPFPYRDCSVGGWYKYELGNNGGAADSAYAEVILTKWNGLQRDTIGRSITYLPPASTYTAFLVEVLVPSQNPNADTINVQFVSSINGFCSNASDGNCLYLTIDQIEVAVPVGLPQPLDMQSGVSIYPCPANGPFSVHVPTGMKGTIQLKIMDMTGRILLSRPIPDQVNEITDHGLAAGNYLWRLESSEGQVKTGRIVMQ